MDLTLWRISVGVLVGLGLGLLVPHLIKRVPEPTPESDDETATLPAKTPYAEIGAQPHLALFTGMLGAVCGGLIGWRLDFGWPFAAWLVFVPIGIALGVIDARTKLLPSYLIKPTYPILLVLIVVPLLIGRDWEELQRTALGWLAYGGFFFVLWLIHPRGMGYGDVRLAGLIGILAGRIGWPEVITTFYGTFLIGPIILLLISGLGARKKQVPFGPFMLLGALVGLVLGQVLLGG